MYELIYYSFCFHFQARGHLLALNIPTIREHWKAMQTAHVLYKGEANNRVSKGYGEIYQMKIVTVALYI